MSRSSVFLCTSSEVVEQGLSCISALSVRSPSTMSALVVVLLQLCRFIDITFTSLQHDMQVEHHIAIYAVDEGDCYSSFCGMHKLCCGKSNRNIYS